METLAGKTIILVEAKLRAAQFAFEREEAVQKCVAEGYSTAAPSQDMSQVAR